MHKMTALQRQALTIVKNTIASMVTSPQWPPAAIFDSDDLADTVSETYMHVLEALPRYDPSRAKLVTFLYPMIRRRALAYAWKLTRGGITYAERPIHFEALPPDGSDDDTEAPATAPDGAQDAGEAALTYHEPPAGLEVPGGDQFADEHDAAQRANVLAGVIALLPEKHANAVRARLDGDGYSAANDGEYPHYTDAWYVKKLLRERGIA